MRARWPIALVVWGVGCAPPPSQDDRSVEPGTLLLACSLDGMRTVTSPEVGSGEDAAVWTQPPEHFVQSLDGQGLLLDADGQWLRFLADDRDTDQPNLDLHRGTLSLWLRPAFPVLDGQRRHLFAALDEQGRGLRIAKAGRDADNALQVELIDAEGRIHLTSVSADRIPWLLLAWERVRIGWDTSGEAEQNVRIWVDDEELLYEQTSADAIAMPSLPEDTHLYLGAWGIDDDHAIRATLDTLEIWAGLMPPS